MVVHPVVQVNEVVQDPSAYPNLGDIERREKRGANAEVARCCFSG
jgi:hypothetical protein